MLCHYFPASNKDFHFLKGQQNRMQRDKGESAPPLPSQSHRLRHRKRSNEIAPETSKTNGSSLLVDDRNKYKSMRTRVLSSVWMIGGFVFILYLGHLYIWAMIVVIQIFMARELFNLLRKAHEEKELPGFRMLNWHFFFTAMIYVYGRFLSRQLVNTVSSDKVLYRVFSNLIKYHMIICYFMYIAGFVWFIVTLKSKMYKYQFGQYAWTHMILFVVFAQSSFTVANIFEGIFWFLLPASLIVINDIAAYFFGFFFGRTPLIKLSPKKTWEGFIGASITTIISAFLLANVLGRFQWLTCPRKDLSTGWLSCDPGPMFKPKQYTLENWVPSWQVKILIDQKKKAWSRVGCTIMTYGCKDARRREFVNFLVSSGQHTVFLRSVDVIHRVRNASFMTSIIKEVIEEVGPSNVIQIITDNASACVKSGRELELDHPHIFWTPCAAHSLDLLLEDLGKLPWIREVVDNCERITKFIYGHGILRSLFLRHSKGKEISRLGATRSATHFLSLRSLLDARVPLGFTFISEEWFPLKEFSILPVSKHALAYGLFASSIAPFGGFFASGFKRAFKIKDFGDSIPGHGGITDRMDCQMVMAVFSYIYYQSFIVVQNTSVESFLDQILGNLSFEEQIVLYKQLGDILYRREHGPLL